LVICITGCATKAPIIEYSPDWNARITEGLEQTRAEANALGEEFYPFSVMAVLETSPTERAKYITDKKTDYKRVRDEAPAVFTKMYEVANGNSRNSLIVSGIGIASGLAASVVLVASPANAVWAAGLSGVATGTLGFQTRLAQEAFTRAAVSREYTRLKSEFDNGANEFSAGMTLLVSYQSDTSTQGTTKWNEGVAKVENGLSRMDRVLIYQFFPMAIDDDLTAIKERDEEILAAIKALYEKNEELEQQVEKALNQETDPQAPDVVLDEPEMSEEIRQRLLEIQRERARQDAVSQQQVERYERRELMQSTPQRNPDVAVPDDGLVLLDEEDQ